MKQKLDTKRKNKERKIKLKKKKEEESEARYTGKINKERKK